MDHKEIRLPQDIYNQYLTGISDIKFTRREMDVIAFIINGRTTKKIASFLSISPKTVDNHISNIMVKLKCHSRDNIIEFIEKSGKFLMIRQYYLSLLTKNAFKNKLKKVSQLLEVRPSSCVIIFEHQQNKKDLESTLIEQLRKDLKFAGVTLFFKSIKQYESFEINLNNRPIHTVFIITHVQLKALTFPGEDPAFSSLFKVIEKIRQNLYLHPLTFVIFNTAPSINIPKIISDIGYIEFQKSENYYLSVFNLLQRICPALNIDKIISEFIKESSLMDRPSDEITLHTRPKAHKRLQKVVIDIVLRYFFRIKKNHILCLAFFICLFYLLFLVYNTYLHKFMTPHCIRSDLITPFEEILLDRPALISKIEESFKRTGSLRTVALVGIAGTGKTTLARQYARRQKAALIWEINAETKETLVASFKKLAHALSITEEDQKTLRDLQEIKDLRIRGGKTLQFIKDHLKVHKEWILIYDNTKILPNFQNQFSQDKGAWGHGKVIVTTQNRNIQNMQALTEMIQVNELDPTEKLTLFMNILNHGASSSGASAQKEEIVAFLKFIPPFPLDVSVAAYYIKSTHITYEKYLKRLSEYNRDFIDVQESILKGTNEYQKVRYNIITLSLDHLMDLHKDFPYFLLFISLVDSQNIPRDLLEIHMNEVSVDNFIFNLNKYSFITDHSSATYPWGTAFSVHRSTQEISLTHLIKRLTLNVDNPLVQRITQNLERYIKQLIEKEDLSQLRLFIPHCEMFLSHHQLLTESAKGSLLSDLGGVYLFLGKYGKAKQCLKEALLKLNNTKDKNKNQNQDKRAQALAYLGDAYGKLGNYEKAKNFLEQSLFIYNQHLPINHGGIAEALTYLGNVYRNLGEYEKAKELLEKSLSIYKTYLPKSYVGNARVSAYLGIVHTILGNYEKAKNILEQSLQIYKTHSSHNHGGVAWVSAHLGNAYGELGNYKEAKQLLEQSIALYKEHFPEEHIKAGWALSYLGDIYRIMGEYEKAKKTLEQSMVIYKKHLPENHIVIAGILVYLSDVHKDLGGYEKARDLLEQSLVIYEKCFPKNHPETAWALSHLGDIYRIMGNFEKAHSLLEKSLAIYRQHFPENHKEVVWALERLRYTRDKIRDYKKDPAGDNKF